tara:strand:+ start:97 stop:246 length:150 start_codon:yes stop_codon:yes gene_type:complete
MIGNDLESMLHHHPKISFPKENLIKIALRHLRKKLDKAKPPKYQKLSMQ